MVLVAPFGLTSCIFESYGDEFYRTLWVAEDLAGRGDDDGSVDVSSDKVTLEFLCGGSVCIRANGAAGSYGSYQPDGIRAKFSDLTLTYLKGGTQAVIILDEAIRNGNQLQLSWHFSKSRTSQHTSMRRLSAYE